MNKGHYCKVCGTRKPNEKFSGKGHRIHVCKSCFKLSVAEQNENATITKINHLPCYLSKPQIEWLRKKTKDRRERVREVAQAEYTFRFQR